MKKYDRIIFIFAFLIILMLTAVNVIFSGAQKNSAHREYRVEINRLADEIERGNEPDISQCSYVVAVVAATETDVTDVADDGNEYSSQNNDKPEYVSALFYNSNYDYVIKNINGKLYRFDYIINDEADLNGRIKINIIMIIVSIVMLAILLYIRKQIIKPFYVLSEIPAELARGNLTIPIKENKSKFFGRFTWGLDMLREKLEDDKRKELSLRKEKQTLLLSISHDVKTPLSAIKLYSSALSKGIYSDEDKKKEAAYGISEKVDEIEKYVTDLTESASDDFLNLEVKKGDFYLSKLMDEIKDYYKDRLSLNKSDFVIEKYNDCIISGDFDRSVEVLQNIFENAIKYGDGKKISVSFGDEEDCRLVTVKNSGCGLPESELVHVFDSFWRGSNSDGRDGSGLGLYICKKLMHMMEGDIYARVDNGDMMVTVVFKRG
ncbi:MAG: HAMP domain-containing histidine kinase [Lachnospiraceae bacterium]|nr:HAMP domain-containing histidine kinase [Lachnospiraceae bacterium]